MEINNTPLKVFDEEVLDLLSGISSDLLKSPLIRQYPDLAAFAFYIRKANLLKLRDTLFLTSPLPHLPTSPLPNSPTSPLPHSELSSRLGRGLCFHIAPGNIPVNFAFTWVFGLLAGNANIVRLPSKKFPQVDALLAIINAHLTSHQSLATRNQFVQYPRTDTEQTAKYCAMADARMIWGGDRTIASIKALPTSPRCVDICFADRYSLAIIGADAILDADDATLKRLAENFYNDTWLMDQNACSSPQIICWLPPTSQLPNSSTSQLLDAAKTKFWSAAESVARAKYQLQDAVAVDKYTLLCEEAVTNPNCKSITRTGNLLYREELTALTPDIINHRGKAGYFFEYELGSGEVGKLGSGEVGKLGSAEESNNRTIEQSNNHTSLFSVITEKFQTITYFGIDPLALRSSLCTHHSRGIDRIVPIGQAMNVGIIWDGHDLVRELSRIINVS